MARVAMWHVACAHICRESHLTDHEQLSRVLPRRPGVYGMFALRHDCAWRGPRPRRQGPDPQKKHRDVEEGFSAIWLHLQGWSQNALPTLKNHRHDCISTCKPDMQTSRRRERVHCSIVHGSNTHGTLTASIPKRQHTHHGTLQTKQGQDSTEPWLVEQVRDERGELSETRHIHNGM